MSGWGGRRVGAGAKRKSDHARAVTGRGARVLSHPSAPDVAPPAPIEEFDAPDDLTMDERHVWLELAPHAFAARTLNKATSMGFRLLCRNVVREKTLGDSALERHGPNHRGLIKIVEGQLLKFNLLPLGKPHEASLAVEQPVNPLERFLKKSQKA